jgi:tyrosyl-tRNA synthetase
MPNPDQDSQPSIPKIAMAEYALDLGIPIVNFLVRLKLADSEAAARQIIAMGGLSLNDAHFTDPEMTITSKHVRGWTLAKAGDRQAWVIPWSDDNGLR